MANQAPKLVLNTDGMPWGRWVQQNVQQHSTDITSLKKTIASSNSVQNAQLKQMAGQIQTLADQQATLATQEAQIEQALSLVVSPASSFANSAASSTMPTSDTAFATATLNVPSGFTKAMVMFGGHGHGACDNNAGDYLYVTISATSSTGSNTGSLSSPPIPAQGSGGVLYGYTQYPQISLFTSRLFTGMSGGTISATISMHAQGSVWGSSPFNGGTISLSAIFMA